MRFFPLLEETPQRSAAPRTNESPSRIAGLVIGKRDLETNAVSLRIHGKGNLGAKKKEEAIAEILLSIKDRSAT